MSLDNLFNRLAANLTRMNAPESYPITLRPYQKLALEYLQDIVHSRNGGIYTLRQARQSGKNEICAIHNYKILKDNLYGDYISFSPTYNQTTISKRRLDKYINFCKLKVRKSEGYIYSNKQDTNIHFLTADPTANIVGHTASLGLTIDEAQDTDKFVYENKIIPMTASTNAPIIMVGTSAYSNDILYEAYTSNLRSTTANNLSFTAEHIAQFSEAYKAHYEAIVDKYGKDSLIVKTQYDLIDVMAGGGLLTSNQLEMVQGGHNPELSPVTNSIYIATIDVGGSSDNINPDNDCTVLVISKLKLGRSAFDRPGVEIVQIYKWQGFSYKRQETEITNLLELWNPMSTVIDARGIGEMLAEYLSNSTPYIEKYKASSTSVSEDVHNFLGYINRNLFKLFTPNSASSKEIHTETMNQLGTVGYKINQNGNINLQKQTDNDKIDICKALSYIPRAIGLTNMFKGVFDVQNTSSPI